MFLWRNKKNINPFCWKKYLTLSYGDNWINRCRPLWLRWMRIRLLVRRLRVRPPPGRNIVSWRFDHEIFSTVILCLPPIQVVQLSVSGERMCTVLVNHLEDEACPVNVWLGKLTALDKTPLGWLGRKTSTQTKYGLTAMVAHSVDSRRAVVSFWHKNVHKYWFTT